MTIETQFETRRTTVQREVTQIGTMIRDLNQVVRQLETDADLEEKRARIFDPRDTAYPILARVLTVRRDNLKATIGALEQRMASLRRIFPEVANIAA